MPTYQSAKTIAENALSTIGAFTASMSAADPGELRKALRWLEMVLNTMSGIRPLAGFWRMVEIPLEAGIGDYELKDYDDAAGTQWLFSASVINPLGDVDPLIIMYENDAALENLQKTGTPERAVLTKDARPVLKVYPTPTQTDEDEGKVLRLRVQTYQDNIDHTGIGDEDVLVRPAWYLVITKRVAYEIGSGPVRRLIDTELKRLKEDADSLEDKLLARDGQYNSSRPPVLDPNDPFVGDHGVGGNGYSRR